MCDYRKGEFDADPCVPVMWIHLHRQGINKFLAMLLDLFATLGSVLSLLSAPNFVVVL